MNVGKLIIYFEDNTITFFRTYDSYVENIADCIIIEDYSCLLDKSFWEKLKSIISNNQLDNCDVIAILHESLFYKEERTMPRFPIFLIRKVLKEELGALFGEKKMKEYKLKISKVKAEGKTVTIEFLLIPTDLTRKLKICLKSISIKKFEIMYT